SRSAYTSCSTWVSRSAISFWYTSTPGTSLLVDQVVGRDPCGDEDRDDVDDFDHGVDGRPGGVLVGVADRVSGDGGLVGFRALPSKVAFLYVLLGVVPSRTTAGHLDRQEQAGDDRTQQQSAQRPRAQEKTNRYRRDDRDDARHHHLPLGCRGHDPHRGAVLGTARAFEDARDLAKLAPHLFHDESAGAPDR